MTIHNLQIFRFFSFFIFKTKNKKNKKNIFVRSVCQFWKGFSLVVDKTIPWGWGGCGWAISKVIREGFSPANDHSCLGPGRDLKKVIREGYSHVGENTIATSQFKATGKNKRFALLVCNFWPFLIILYFFLFFFGGGNM